MGISDLNKDDWDQIISLLSDSFIKIVGLEVMLAVRDSYMVKKTIEFPSGSLASHISYAIKSCLGLPFKEIPIHMGEGNLKDAVYAFRLEVGR